ncbi:MAG: aldo/keto reductase [Methanomassiliicoccales archaeon]|jgi:diketogulonate reductase-like aldo/keto reductase
MVSLNIDDRIPLGNGHGIPVLGFGTYRLEPGRQTRNAVSEALTVGYLHIDTARLYKNEKDVGQAILDSGIAREDIFVTTKLQNSDHGRKKALSAFLESNESLGLGYVDLFLLHWPVPGLRNESWKALEELYKEGLCRAIGVSNFMPRHLEELLADCDVVPMVEQVELSPYLQQKELVDMCTKNGIVVEAYCPLTRGKRLGDPRLVKIAGSHGKTPAQVLIRYALQKGNVPLPKSKHPARIRENADVFDFALTDEDIAEMDGWEEGLRTSWNPTRVL